jgi:signal transduction histidine kinase
LARREDLASSYAACLERYLAEPDEGGLSASYELGRSALESGYGVTDIVVAHRAAVSSETNGETSPAAARATAFLLECLAPLEMAYLGYREANESLRALNAQLELRVRERTAQLEAAVGELEAFSYSVSHDLRAPLRAIHGFCTLLGNQLGDDLPPEALHALQRVKAGAERMGVLIDELLNLSRIGCRPLAPRTVDLSVLAHEVIAELRDADPQHDIEVSIEEGLRVTGDPELLRIVLVNLLGNAFKYTRHTASARVWVSGSRDGEHLSVQVRDNGAGFDMAYADKLFMPFQRLHASDEYPGTGIGLATVQRVIHRHAGSVHATGAVGRGATLTVTLPAATEPEPATTAGGSVVSTGEFNDRPGPAQSSAR